MKRKVSVLLSLIMILSGLQVTVMGGINDTGFIDVNTNNKYVNGIKYCVNNGIIRRTAITEFSPDANLNRELLACILYRLEESPANKNTVSFTDVGNGRWFQTGVVWAAENNILVGYGNGSFGVDEGITREQFLTALWRYMGEPDVEGTIAFTDNNDISAWAEIPVMWAGENKIIENNGELKPKEIVTRGEAAEVLMNFLKIKATPYMTNGGNNVTSRIKEAEFVDKVKMTIDGVEGEAIVNLIDSKPTREFIAQLPMTINCSDFGSREKYGKMPVALSENEALLSGYEIGDFSYGTPYDCMIMFYAQDNEVIDGIIKLGTFESGLDLFTGKDDIDVTIEVINGKESFEKDTEVITENNEVTSETKTETTTENIEE